MGDPAKHHKASYFGASPTPEGWVVFYNSAQMRKEDVVGAAHLKPGTDLDTAKKNWSADEITAARSIFDGVVGIRYGDSKMTLDQVRSIMHAIEFRSYIRSSQRGAQPGPGAGPDAQPQSAPPKPNPERKSRLKNPPPGSGASTRAIAPKPGGKVRHPGRSRADRAEDRSGSRKGKKDGNVGNNPFLAVLGAAQAFVDGVGEMAFMVYDSFGTQLEYVTMGGYEHDYISSVGRALDEEGKTVGDLLDAAVEGATDGTVNALNDLARGDFYAFGYEAPGTPVVSAATGVLGGGGLSRLRAAGRRGPGPGHAGGPARGGGSGGGGPPRRPAGPDPDDWSDVNRALDLDDPGTFGNSPMGRANKTEQLHDAVQNARQMGWIDAEGGGVGRIEAALQKHRDAGPVKDALGLDRSQYQSAHMGSASVLEQTPGWSDKDALTQIMPREPHGGLAANNIRGFDYALQSRLRAERRAGGGQMTLRTGLELEQRGLRRAGQAIDPSKPVLGRGTDWMTPERQKTMQWLLESEYFKAADRMERGMQSEVATSSRASRGTRR